jgi:hypothetical protein
LKEFEPILQSTSLFIIIIIIIIKWGDYDLTIALLEKKHGPMFNFIKNSGI